MVGEDRMRDVGAHCMTDEVEQGQSFVLHLTSFIFEILKSGRLCSSSIQRRADMNGWRVDLAIATKSSRRVIQNSIESAGRH